VTALRPDGESAAEPQLVCAECGAVSEGDAAGWRAYLDDDGQAVPFCPECAGRESVPRRRSHPARTQSPTGPSDGYELDASSIVKLSMASTGPVDQDSWGRGTVV
jgi:hypothetical protein